MRIAIAHPTTLDRVPRGNERYMHELAVWLASRGHDVTIVSCKPGPREVTRILGYTQDCHRRWWHPGLERFGVLEAYPFLLTTFLALLRGRFDVVYACTHTSGVAASLAQRFTGTPYVFVINALPPPVKYYRALSLGGRVFDHAVANAAEVVCWSRYVQEFARKRFGRAGVVIPCLVDTVFFHPTDAARFEPPVIFCAAALGDKRKGGSALMRAFNLVKAARPEVQLWNNGPLLDRERDELLSLVEERWRHDVRFLPSRDRDALPELYGRSTVSVLPSLWEAFGLVTVESLACGTPVVGTRDGATPELLSSDRVGCLFDPGDPTCFEPTNVEGLAQALLDGLKLGERPETAAHCRARALDFAWDAIGPRHEALFEQVARGTR